MITVDLLFDAKTYDILFDEWVNLVPEPPKQIVNDFRFTVLREDSALVCCIS